MRNKGIIGVAAFAMACSGDGVEQGELCTELPVDVTVVNAAGEPLTTAMVEIDNVSCPGDGTTNVYKCKALQNATGTYQIVILEPNSNAFSEFVLLPAPEEWCDVGVFPFSAQLGAMMGA